MNKREILQKFLFNSRCEENFCIWFHRYNNTMIFVSHTPRKIEVVFWEQKADHKFAYKNTKGAVDTKDKMTL